MIDWQPTAQQQRDWDEKGYFIARSLVSVEAAAEMRGVIKNVLLSPEPDARTDADPMDPMGDTPEARAARFRKLSAIPKVQSPNPWRYRSAPSFPEKPG